MKRQSTTVTATSPRMRLATRATGIRCTGTPPNHQPCAVARRGGLNMTRGANGGANGSGRTRKVETTDHGSRPAGTGGATNGTPTTDGRSGVTRPPTSPRRPEYARNEVWRGVDGVILPGEAVRLGSVDGRAHMSCLLFHQFVRGNHPLWGLLFNSVRGPQRSVRL